MIPIWKYGFGLGQGGRNIITTISDYNLVGRVCRVDYDMRDMIMNNGDSIVLDKNGAGGDSNKGAEYFKEIAEQIQFYIEQNINKKEEKLLVCAGGGNGTGDGSIIPFIKISNEMGIKPFVVFTLPKDEEGLSPKKNALERLVSMVNFCLDDVSGLLMIDNEYVTKELNSRKISFTGYNPINKILVDNLTFFSKLTQDKKTVFIDSYKVFDFNDFINMLNDSGITNLYEVNLETLDINELEEYVKKSVGKSSLFSGNMNLNTVRSGVALIEVPDYYSSIKTETVLTNIYKGLSNRFKLSKKFIFTAVKSDKLVLHLLVTGMTISQKISVDAKHLQTSVKRFKDRNTADKINVDLGFYI